jgi:uncharacterized membrane protein (UPF0127 family)
VILRRFRTAIQLLALVAVVAAAGCKPAGSLPTVETVISAADGKELGVFSVEVAATNDERAKGLMFRRELGPREGMLFVFPEQRQLSFWMKNTLIPLDMIFVSREWKVVGIIENATPLSEEARGVDAESQYVLEFSGGTAARLGIGRGATVHVRGGMPQPRYDRD